MTATAVPAAPISEAAPSSGRSLAFVLALGAVVELALVAGLTVPLWLGRSGASITDWEPLARMSGISWLGLSRFMLTLIVWGAGYIAALYLSRRPLSASARRALFLLPVLFALTLAPTWPAASKDVYHYVMEGRALVSHHLNPLVAAPADISHDPLYWIISSWEGEPSRYGPVWAVLAAVPTLLADMSLRGQVLAFKAIGIVSFLAVAWLSYVTVRRSRPEAALTAYVLVGWSPLLLFEAAANAHNDLVMLAFTALALERASRRDWAMAFPALAAGALVKYVCGLLGPLMLVWAWRSARDGAERWRIVAGLALGSVLTLGSYGVFWAGADTFSALSGATGDAVNSPGWLLRAGLERLGLGRESAHTTITVLLLPLFLLGYALALRMVWRGRGDLMALWSAGLLAMAVEVSTLSWWFWPWYITWLLPLAAVLAGERAARLVVVWSLAALAAYIPINYRPLFWGEVPDGRMPFFAALVVFIPAAVAAWLLFRPWPRVWLRRRTPAGPREPAPSS